MKMSLLPSSPWDVREISLATHEPASPLDRQQALFDQVVDLPAVSADDFAESPSPQTIGELEEAGLSIFDSTHAKPVLRIANNVKNG